MFFIFWSNEKVCGIHIHVCFWPISVACAVRVARFVSSGVSAYQSLEVFRDRFGKREEERNCYAVWFRSGRLSKILRILFTSLPPIVFVVFQNYVQLYIGSFSSSIEVTVLQGFL